MSVYYSKYYQQHISAEQLINLVRNYVKFCSTEGLLPVYTLNDVLLAIDEQEVTQELINQLITFSLRDNTV